jgi:hypothetical protein
MKLHAIGVAVLLSIAVAAMPVAAQPYSVHRNADVVQLEDTKSRMSVSVAVTVGNIAFEMKVNGANVLWWPYASVEEFKTKPALSGIRRLMPAPPGSRAGSTSTSRRPG